MNQSTLTKHVCITCKTNPVNPMISETDKFNGKSFCSRICKNIWNRSDLQYLSREAIQKIALTHLRSYGYVSNT
jgi:formate dehydrogenase maturation protein FdhE